MLAVTRRDPFRTMVPAVALLAVLVLPPNALLIAGALLSSAARHWL